MEFPVVDGIPEIVHNQVNGLLVPPDSPNEMAEAISHLLTTASVYGRYAKAARSGALAYSPESVTNRLEAIYEKAL